MLSNKSMVYYGDLIRVFAVCETEEEKDGMAVALGAELKKSEDKNEVERESTADDVEIMQIG